jgi:preprotein translocase subunit SecG
MTILVVILHVLACISLILIVLLQAGKGADIGASMGGAGSQTLFGTTGATTVLSKVTTGIAVVFMLTSLFLAYHSGHIKETPSVMTDVAPAADEKAPKADVQKSAPAETENTEKTVTPEPAAEKGNEAPASNGAETKTP